MIDGVAGVVVQIGLATIVGCVALDVVCGWIFRGVRHLIGRDR